METSSFAKTRAGVLFELREILHPSGSRGDRPPQPGRFGRGCHRRWVARRPASAGPSETSRRGPAARVSARWAARGEERGASRSDADPCPAGAERRARGVDTPLRKPLRFEHPGKAGGCMQTYGNYIDGEWAAAASGRTLDV